jgi:hypothetical protein
LSLSNDPNLRVVGVLVYWYIGLIWGIEEWLIESESGNS